MPVEGRIFKTIRADDQDFWDMFAESLISPESFRPELRVSVARKAFTVKLVGNEYKVVPTDKQIKHQMPGEEPNIAKKLQYTRHQSTSFANPKGGYIPPPFGHDRDRRELLVGVSFSPDDCELKRIMFYDGGTVTRSYDFDTEIEAYDFLTQQLDAGNYHKSLSSLEQAGLHKQTLHNEVMAKLKWTPRMQVTIFSDSIESRLLAQLRAKDLENRLNKKYQSHSPKQIPITFYPAFTIYSEEEQQKDRELAPSNPITYAIGVLANMPIMSTGITVPLICHTFQRLKSLNKEIERSFKGIIQNWIMCGFDPATMIIQDLVNLKTLFSIASTREQCMRIFQHGTNLIQTYSDLQDFLLLSETDEQIIGLFEALNLRLGEIITSSDELWKILRIKSTSPQNTLIWDGVYVLFGKYLGQWINSGFILKEVCSIAKTDEQFVQICKAILSGSHLSELLKESTDENLRWFIQYSKTEEQFTRVIEESIGLCKKLDYFSLKYYLALTKEDVQTTCIWKLVEPRLGELVIDYFDLLKVIQDEELFSQFDRIWKVLAPKIHTILKIQDSSPGFRSYSSSITTLSELILSPRLKAEYKEAICHHIVTQYAALSKAPQRFMFNSNSSSNLFEALQTIALLAALHLINTRYNGSKKYKLESFLGDRAIYSSWPTKSGQSINETFQSDITDLKDSLIDGRLKRAITMLLQQVNTTDQKIMMPDIYGIIDTTGKCCICC